MLTYSTMSCKVESKVGNFLRQEVMGLPILKAIEQVHFSQESLPFLIPYTNGGAIINCFFYASQSLEYARVIGSPKKYISVPCEFKSRGFLFKNFEINLQK